MEFTIKCIKEYKTYNDLVLFKCGKKYKLVIQDDNTVIVMYDAKNGTKFIGGLSKYFSKQ